jgi:hypothetical protein
MVAELDHVAEPRARLRGRPPGRDRLVERGPVGRALEQVADRPAAGGALEEAGDVLRRVTEEAQVAAVGGVPRSPRRRGRR